MLRSRAALVAMCLVPLSGCMSGGFDFASDTTVDKGTRTASVPGGRADGTSDAATVRNAVSSTDLTRNANTPIPWANAVSGSAGVVNSVSELNDEAGRTCRDFTTTLHSYSGVAAYDGRTCVGRDGMWMLTRFDRQQ